MTKHEGYNLPRGVAHDQMAEQLAQKPVADLRAFLARHKGKWPVDPASPKENKQ